MEELKSRNGPILESMARYASSLIPQAADLSEEAAEDENGAGAPMAAIASNVVEVVAEEDEEEDCAGPSGVENSTIVTAVVATVESPELNDLPYIPMPNIPNFESMKVVEMHAVLIKLLRPHMDESASVDSASIETFCETVLEYAIKHVERFDPECQRRLAFYTKFHDEVKSQHLTASFPCFLVQQSMKMALLEYPRPLIVTRLEDALDEFFIQSMTMEQSLKRVTALKDPTWTELDAAFAHHEASESYLSSCKSLMTSIWKVLQECRSLHNIPALPPSPSSRKRSRRTQST